MYLLTLQLFCGRSSFKNAQVQAEGNEEAEKEVEFTRDREGMTNKISALHLVKS